MCLLPDGFVMGDTGPEHHTKSPVNPPVSEAGGAESGALDAQKPANQPTVPTDLVPVVEAWTKLPEAVRVGILAMVQAAGKKA